MKALIIFGLVGFYTIVVTLMAWHGGAAEGRRLQKEQDHLEVVELPSTSSPTYTVDLHCIESGRDDLDKPHGIARLEFVDHTDKRHFVKLTVQDYYPKPGLVHAFYYRMTLTPIPPFPKPEEY